MSEESIKRSASIAAAASWGKLAVADHDRADERDEDLQRQRQVAVALDRLLGQPTGGAMTSASTHPFVFDKSHVQQLMTFLNAFLRENIARSQLSAYVYTMAAHCQRLDSRIDMLERDSTIRDERYAERFNLIERCLLHREPLLSTPQPTAGVEAVANRLTEVVASLFGTKAYVRTGEAQCLDGTVERVIEVHYGLDADFALEEIQERHEQVLQHFLEIPKADRQGIVLARFSV
jgi:hypothetical protein